MTNIKSVLMLTVGLSLTLAVSSVQTGFAETVWLEEDDFRSPAQGDGDYEPTNINITQEEVSLQVKEPAPVALVADVQPQNGTESLPTLTAEGSFLLPTYVLPEAKEAKQTTVTSVDESNPWRQTEKTTTTHTRRTFVKGSATLPPAKTTTVTSSTNSQEAQLLANIEKQYQKTSALLEDTSRRLAVLEAGVENLSQQPVAPPQTIQMGQVTPNMQTQTTVGSTGTISVTKQPEEVRREPLLLPLAPSRSRPVFNDDMESDSQAAAQPARIEYVDYILGAIKRNTSKQHKYSESDELILKSIPKEMKISFLPNTADLSDQAFKWIKVFAYNPMRSAANAVEIRLSGENLDLQSRRFALIKGVLLSNGVSARQIRFVFTDRDPDTIILRDVVLQENLEYITKTQKNGKTSQQIIQKW